MSDEQGAIPEALERLFDQAFADGIAAGKSGDESILAGSAAVYARSALTIVAADRLTDTGAGAAYWQGYDAGKRAALTPKPPVDAGAVREGVRKLLLDRAAYFESAKGYREWKDAARSYRATADEVDKLFARNLSDDGETM